MLPDGLIKSLERGTQLQGSNKYAFHVLDSHRHTLCWVAQKYSSLIPITDTGREHYRRHPVLQLGKQRLESSVTCPGWQYEANQGCDLWPRILGSACSMEHRLGRHSGPRLSFPAKGNNDNTPSRRGSGEAVELSAWHRAWHTVSVAHSEPAVRSGFFITDGEGHGCGDCLPFGVQTLESCMWTPLEAP